MERYIDMRAFGVLGAFLCLALGVGLSACHKDGGQQTYQVQLIVDNGEGGEEQASPEAIADGEPQAETSDQSSSAEAPEQEPGEPSLDTASLAAGDVVTPDAIASAGGVDAFFWSEEIPDAVFARMEGKSFGPDCTMARSDLRYLRLLHVDAQGTTKVGELVVHKNVADEVVVIFRQLYDAGYPIKKMHLVDDYNADDDASCADDNTSAFNYRLIAGTNTISNHAYGLAIDINTFENPYCRPETGYVSPAEAAYYADRSLYEPYMIHTDDLCYQLFTQHGWSWGGDWSSPKDYQHFEKPGALWQ